MSLSFRRRSFSAAGNLGAGFALTCLIQCACSFSMAPLSRFASPGELLRSEILTTRCGRELGSLPCVLYTFYLFRIHMSRGRIALMSRWLQAIWHLQATPSPIDYGLWIRILLSSHKVVCYTSFRSIILNLVGYSATNPSRASTRARPIPRAAGTAQSPTTIHYVHLHKVSYVLILQCTLYST